MTREQPTQNAANQTGAVRGVDVVYHCAAAVGSAYAPRQIRDINWTAARHLLEALRQNGSSRAVILTSVNVLGTRNLDPATEGIPCRRSHDAAANGPSLMNTLPPNYGIDAPRAVSVLFLLSAAALATVGLMYGLGLLEYLVAELTAISLLIGAVDLLLVALAMLWYSRAGKMHQRDLLLQSIPWNGSEQVLDIGCGRGLLLIGAAQRLSTGKAVGVDIWSNVDLSANRPDATLENARRAGVAERVEVHDADAQKLPFADASFEVVVSSLVLHNIPRRQGRQQAVREIARVLKPGGRVAILDLRHTRDYVEVLRKCGLDDARRAPVGVFLTWLFPLLTWGAISFFRVTGQKS